MKKGIHILLVIIIAISCMTCLSSCKQNDGELEDIDALLLNDPELNALFSNISVQVSDGKKFNASLTFKKMTSEMISDISEEDACAIAKMVHDKIKAAVLDAGYNSIRWIEAMMYSSDRSDVENDYILSFGVAAGNKTYVKVWTDAFNPLFDVEVSWGGFDELG